MFVNYFSDHERSSPINLAAARAVLGGWLIWKTIMYDWRLFLEVPVYLTPEFAWAVPPTTPALLLTIEKWILIGLLAAFVLGYRIRLTALVSALLVGHLGTIRATQITSGETEALFIGVYFLIFFALFADSEGLSIDQLRAARRDSAERLRSRLQSGGKSYEMSALKWSLVVIALIYFGSGFDKIFHAGLTNPTLEFATADNLARIITLRSPDHPFGFLLEYSILVRAGAVGTLVIELGFLIAVLVGTTITPVILAFVAFTVSNVFWIGIHFVDVYFIVAVFAAWDAGCARVVSDREIDVVFDGQSRACMRGLLPFALVDVNDSMRFLSRSEARDRLQDWDDVDAARTLTVIDDGAVFEGYDAVQELLRQLRVFFPVVWLMNRPSIERATTTAYRRFA